MKSRARQDTDKNKIATKICKILCQQGHGSAYDLVTSYKFKLLSQNTHSKILFCSSNNCAILKSAI